LSVLFNADENSSQILRGTFTQDFREVHASCSVTFAMEERMMVSPGDTFFFMGGEWDFVSCKRISQQKGEIYSVFGYPKGMSEMIRQSHYSLSGLAGLVGITFDNTSTDVLFEFPLNGVRLGPLLYKYRYQSIEQNMDDVGRAVFLHVDQRGLVGKSYRSMVTEKVFDLYPGVLGNTLNVYSVEDRLRNLYRQDPVPRKTSYKQMVTALVGKKVEMQGIISGLLGGHYKLHTGESDLDELDKMLLVRQRFDSSRGVQPWALTFGRLEV
jgi:hypothetical protein